MKKDDPLYDHSLSTTDRDHRWRFYVASFNSLDPTQGVDHSKLSRALLPRNLRKAGADPRSTAQTPATSGDGQDEDTAFERRLESINANEALVMRISVGEYKRVFDPDTADSWVFSTGANESAEAAGTADTTRTLRAAKMQRLLNTSAATQALSVTDVALADTAFNDIIAGMPSAAPNGVTAAPQAMQVDA